MGKYAPTAKNREQPACKDNLTGDHPFTNITIHGITQRLFGWATHALLRYGRLIAVRVTNIDDNQAEYSDWYVVCVINSKTTAKHKLRGLTGILDTAFALS